MANFSGTVTSRQGVVTIDVTPGDAVAFTPSTATYTVEYPIGTVAVNASSSAATVNANSSATQMRILCVSGSVAYVCTDATEGQLALVSNSRTLTAADNGLTLECTATVTLTVPVGLANFGCAIIPSGTTSIASDGTALLNGGTSTVTRAAGSNALFAIQCRASAVDSYVVTGS